MSCMMTANTVSSALRDKADDLANSGKLLLGNDFKDHMVDTSKTKRKSMEAFFAKSPPAKKPFRGGPLGSYKTAFRKVHPQHPIVEDIKKEGREAKIIEVASLRSIKGKQIVSFCLRKNNPLATS